MLGDLPAGFRCLAVGESYLVLGPTGVFVIGDGTHNPGSAARALSQWAARFRGAVAEVLSWAPFVEVLLVADRPRAQVESVSVVSPDLLVDVLVSGAALLARDDVEELAALAEGVVATA